MRVLPILLVPALAAAAAAQCSLGTVAASDGAAGAQYGAAVALDGDRALVGAWGADAVYVLEPGPAGWVETAQLVAGAPGGGFGYAVALDGDRALVGAPDANAAFVFVDDGAGFSLEAELVADGQDLGFAVSLSGDVAAVGAPGDGSGAVFVFERAGGRWTEVAALHPDDGAFGDRFGAAVALGAGVLAVGAPQADAAGFSSGAAHLYERSGGAFAPAATLVAEDGAAGDEFGSAVAADRGVVLVGARWDDDGADAAGSVSVYERGSGGWSRTAKLLASDGGGEDSFGRALALRGDRALVGTSGVDRAYLFERAGGTWSEVATFDAGDAPRAVALSADLALLGTPFANEAGSLSGAAALFSTSTGIFEPLGGGVGGFALEPPGLSGLASGRDCATWTIRYFPAYPFTTATLIAGAAPLGLPFKGGTLVPTPDVVLPGLPIQAGAFELEFVVPPHVPPGVPLWLQAIQPDPFAPSGLAVSDALTVETP